MLDECNRRTTVLCMHEGVCLVISPRNASGSQERKKNGVVMALDVATLPLILYRIRYIITIEYYIARTSYTFLPCFITLP